MRGRERRAHHRLCGHLAHPLDRGAGLPLTGAVEHRGHVCRRAGGGGTGTGVGGRSRRGRGRSGRGHVGGSTGEEGVDVGARDDAVLAARRDSGEVDALVLGVLADRGLGERLATSWCCGVRCGRRLGGGSRGGRLRGCGDLHRLGCRSLRRGTGPLAWAAGRGRGGRAVTDEVRLALRLRRSSLARGGQRPGLDGPVGVPAVSGLRTGGPGRPTVCGCLVAGVDHDDRGPDVDRGALLDQDLGDRAGPRDRQLDQGLGRLDLHDDVVDLDLVADLDLPGDDLGLDEALTGVREVELWHCGLLGERAGDGQMSESAGTQ